MTNVGTLNTIISQKLEQLFWIRKRWFAEANRRFKAETLTGNRTFAFRVADAAEAVEEIFASGGSRALLHKHCGLLKAV